MENYKMWHIIFVVFATITYWVLMLTSMYTPAWNVLQPKRELPPEQVPDELAPKMIDQATRESRSNKIEVGIMRTCYVTQAVSECEINVETFYIYEAGVEYTAYSILSLAALALFIGWVWSLSIFFCRCCRFYWALPMFSGIALIFWFAGIIYYAFNGKESNLAKNSCLVANSRHFQWRYTSGLIESSWLSAESVSDWCDTKLGYSFIIGVLVIVALVFLVAVGIYVALAPKPPPVTSVQPMMYGGGDDLVQPPPNSYGEGNQEEKPTSYYNKSEQGGAQAIQYPMG